MTIAGSDPSGGAGLQADLKTFAACRVHGYAVITAVIAQNSKQVKCIMPVDAAMVTAQIDTLIAERPPGALKTGALATAAIVRSVADAIATHALPSVVVDPVLLSSSGARLLDAAGEAALRTRLIPLARVVTPNIPEAEALSGVLIDGPAGLREAARALRRMGARAAVIKGGHGFSAAPNQEPGGGASQRVQADAIDLFFDGRQFIELAARRIPGEGAHGTGCAFAAAIAAWLARGADLERAVREAKRFVTAALRRSYILAPGSRPILGHLGGGLAPACDIRRRRDAT